MSKIKRLKWVALVGTGTMLAVTIAVLLSGYADRPRIQYRLKRTDCSSAAIAARNKTLGANLKACVLVVTATNLQNRTVSIDYDGVGGGPLGTGRPLIRIYSQRGTFCYALLGDSGTFAPHATSELTLRCGGVPHPPKDYSMASDTDPATVRISGPSAATLRIAPVKPHQP